MAGDGAVDGPLVRAAVSHSLHGIVVIRIAFFGLSGLIFA
jgi:hypothetical protein